MYSHSPTCPSSCGFSAFSELVLRPFFTAVSSALRAWCSAFSLTSSVSLCLKAASTLARVLDKKKHSLKASPSIHKTVHQRTKFLTSFFSPERYISPTSKLQCEFLFNKNHMYMPDWTLLLETSSARSNNSSYKLLLTHQNPDTSAKTCRSPTNALQPPLDKITLSPYHILSSYNLKRRKSASEL